MKQNFRDVLHGIFMEHGLRFSVHRSSNNDGAKILHNLHLTSILTGRLVSAYCDLYSVLGRFDYSRLNESHALIGLL